MSAAPTSPTTLAALDAWSPRRVVCGVDGSRGSVEAVRQALEIADPSALVRLALVNSVSGHGAAAMAAIAPDRAQRALAKAARLARAAGVGVEESTIDSSDPADALLELAGEADLLAVGAGDHSRAGGIVLGRVATAAAHRAPCDVLLARADAAKRPLASDVLLAFDSSAAAWRAAAMAGAIAKRHESRVTIAAVGSLTSEQRHALACVVVAMTDATGREPVVEGGGGDAHDEIVRLAGALDASLVVLGARGLTGARALGSVSERVAHRARCSVLIARGRAQR